MFKYVYYKFSKDMLHMFHDTCLGIHLAYTLWLCHDIYDDVMICQGEINDYVMLCHDTLRLCYDMPWYAAWYNEFPPCVMSCDFNMLYGFVSRKGTYWAMSAHSLLSCTTDKGKEWMN